MSEWRVIETAPRDGTKIDVWADGRRIADASWGDYDDWVVTPSGRQGWRYHHDEHATYYSIDPPPTHWMPLPEPPE